MGHEVRRMRGVRRGRRRHCRGETRVSPKLFSLPKMQTATARPRH